MSKAKCVGVSKMDFKDKDGKSVVGDNLFYNIPMIGVEGEAAIKKFFNKEKDEYAVWVDLVRQAAGNEKNLPGKMIDIVFGPKGNVESIKLITA